MIKRTRRKLVWGYTLAIIVILILSSLAGILALNYFTNTAMTNSLIPELEAEVVESRTALRNWLSGANREPVITHFESHELAFTVMEYWFSATGDLVMAEGSDDISDLLVSLIQDWAYPNMEIEALEFSDGEGKVWQFIIIADDVYDDDGAYLGKVIVGTNMTPLTRINQQYLYTALVIIVIISVLAFFVGNYFAAKAIKPVAETMEKQRHFVADASHELRTPLSVMLASVDMLKPDEDSKQAVADIREEIINMRNLVNSMLVLAQSDTGLDAAAFSDVDLCATALDVARGMQHLADSKKIKIVHTLPQSLIVQGNELRLRQLVTILLDNAIKYSLENMVVLLNISQRYNQAVISVQDYGQGIAQKDLENIFERFYRADKARSRAQGGFGLGLPIARLIVQSHGGNIKVESALGKGSVFTANLPLKQRV